MKENILNNFKDSQYLAYEAMEYIKDMRIGKSSILDDTDPSTKYFLKHTLSPAIKNGEGVVLFSFNISSKELIVRLLSLHTSIPLKKLCIADVTDKQWEALAEAIDEINSAKIYVNEKLNISQLW